MSKEDNFPVLTAETAVIILTRTLDELQLVENARKLEEARDNVGNEMLKMMQYVFPVVMQVQMDVIKEYGFPEGREGIIRFAQMLRALEHESEEVARLHSSIKAYYLPPVAVNASNEAMLDDRTASS